MLSIVSCISLGDNELSGSNILALVFLMLSKMNSWPGGSDAAGAEAKCTEITCCRNNLLLPRKMKEMSPRFQLNRWKPARVQSSRMQEPRFQTLQVSFGRIRPRRGTQEVKSKLKSKYRSGMPSRALHSFGIRCCTRSFACLRASMYTSEMNSVSASANRSAE